MAKKARKHSSELEFDPYDDFDDVYDDDTDQREEDFLTYNSGELFPPGDAGFQGLHLGIRSLVGHGAGEVYRQR